MPSEPPEYQGSSGRFQVEQVRDQGGARVLVKYPSRLAGILLESGDGLIDERVVIGHRRPGAPFGMTTAFVGFIVVALVGGAAEMASAFSGARRKSAGPERGHRAGERIPNRALRRSDSGTAQ